MGTHALLSPSAAHRWLHCTASPLLEKEVPDHGSTFAEEGTLAHSYCARHLKMLLGQPHDGEDREIAEYYDRYHTGEMDEYTEVYKANVMEKFNAARTKTPDAQLLVEVRLDFSSFMPSAFGTADAIIIADGLMEVIDFKYGKGVRVEAHDNPQMMIYALGAVEAFEFEYNIGAVRMTIVQPRIDNLSEAMMGGTELVGWRDAVLKPRAIEAYNGEGHQEPGEWCRFCKVRQRCKALAGMCVSTEKERPSPLLMSKTDMETVVLPRLAVIKSWLADVEEYALAQALSGVSYEGFKVVEGRSVRKITDPAKVMTRLADEGYPAETYIKPRELRGISDLERLVGKKRFTALCSEWIDKPAGKPTLVPESDKRPAYNPAVSDFNGIDIN